MDEAALRSTPWSLLTYGSTRAILLVSTIVLARILRPSDFGLLALATLAVGVFGFLGELGLGSAFTARQDLDRRAQGTVLSLMLAAGGFTAVVVTALAPLIARLFGAPRLAPVLAVLSLTLFINGFTWFYEQVLVRELAFQRRFIALLCQALGNGIVTISAALLGAGVWSLVVGQLAGMAVQAAVQLRVTPYRVHLSWDRQVARRMIRAGRGFMALGGLTFVRQNLDYFAVARVLGPRPLGFYSMAYRLTDLPSAAVAGPIAKVTFPTFARMHARGEDVGGAFLKTLRYIALITVPVAVGLSAAARPLTLTVLGEQWLPMVETLVVLGIWSAVRSLQVTCSWFLNALDRAGTSAALTAISIGILGPGTFAAASVGRLEMVALVILLEGVVTLGLHLRVIVASGVSVGRQIQALWPAVLAGVGSWIGTRAAVELTDHLAAPLSLLISFVTLTSIFVTSVTVFAPSMYGEAKGLLIRSLRTTAG